MNAALPELTLVVPAYNEAEALPQVMDSLLETCRRHHWKLVVVNDGSTDDTAAVLATYAGQEALDVVHHKVNRGYGGAIKSGIRKVSTPYCVTLDADGQHDLADVEAMLGVMKGQDADLVIGNRKGHGSGWYREAGKALIRRIARLLMPLPVHDINSGLKMYRSDRAKKYMAICPDSMAFSDIMTLTFVYQRDKVLEVPVNIRRRIAGKSTIGVRTALDTVMEIINIVTLFNPMRIFLPLSVTCILLSLAWALPILLRGHGVSIGALLGFITGILFFLLGLIAEQLGNLRRSAVNHG